MPSNAQIQQLVLQVDANVAVAQRSLQDLARVVNQSASQMNASLAANDQAIGRSMTNHAKLGLAFNNARIAQTELTAALTRSVDAYGAGASPIRILSTEIGRLTEAASFLGGGAGNGVLGTIVRFIGGPWGIAMLLGASVLAKIIAGHKDAGDSVEALVDKMRKQAQQAANSKLADAEWAASIDGLIDRNLKLIDTLQKRLKAEEDLDAQTLRQAEGDKVTAERNLADAQTKLANLKAEQAALQRAQATGGAGTRAGSLTPVAQSNVLSSQIAQAEADVRHAQEAVTAAQNAIAANTIAVGEAMGKAMADSSAQIDLWAKDYTEALHNIEIRTPDATAQIAGAFETLKKALGDASGANVPFKSAETQANSLARDLNSGKITVLQYADAIKKLAAQLEAAAEASKNAKKGTGEFGKQIGFAEAESIAKSAGLTVTSGYRSIARQAELYNDPNVNKPGNPVARPGASAHNGLNGRWALDIAFAPGLTAESLKKIYGDQGVTLSAIYKESGHFHIEGSTSRATSAANAAARAAQKQQTDDDQFAKESAQLDAELLQAKKALTVDFNTQADISEKELEAQKEAELAAIKKQVDAKQITAVQGQILSSKVEELSAAKKAVIEQKRAIDALDAQQRAIDQSLGFRQDDLKFADDMATTQGERRKIELQILDIQYQQKQIDLQILLAKQKQLGDIQGAELTQAQLDRLPTQKAEDQARVIRGTQDPLRAWAQQVPHTAAQINEALQSIEVQGIDNLASAITGVITGTKSLGAAFRDVAQQIIGDIIQMTIKMLIFRALSSVFGGAFGGGGGMMDFSGFGNFGNVSFSGATPKLAGGGIMDIGGSGGVDTNLLSLNGKPLAMVSQGEKLAVIPKASRMNFSGAAANSNSPAHVVVELRDDMLDARIENGAGRVVIATAPTLVRTAHDTTMKTLTRKKLA